MSLFAAIDAGLVGTLEHARNDERGENAEDHDHDEHLDQREPAARRAAVPGGRHRGDYNPPVPVPDGVAAFAHGRAFTPCPEPFTYSRAPRRS